MTKTDLRKTRKNGLCSAINILILLLVFIISIKYSPKINLYVKDGLSLCFEAIIGSVFPFMIITDVISELNSFDRMEKAKKAFEKIFRINAQAMPAFVLGILCGFPVGAKMAVNLLRKGVITKEECERLMGFSCNMGPAFIISGVGVALCKSAKAGIILYASATLSSIISGALIAIGKSPSKSPSQKTKSVFSLTDSIKSATVSTLTICGFIVFFSGVCGVLRTVINNDFFYSLSISFFEVSNATKGISALNFISEIQKLSLISFAVSFSGLSIFMQAKSFASEDKISMKPYLKTKLIQGLTSMILTLQLV